MSFRPADWTALELSHDPVPGDPAVVSASASDYREVADAIIRAKRQLEVAFSDDALRGDAIDAVRDVASEVADRIGRARERYSAVAEVLTGYVTPLAVAQQDSVALLGRAQVARDERHHAERMIARWQEELEEAAAAGDALGESEARRQLLRWQGEVAAANDTVAMVVAGLNQVIESRDSAANAAADAIEEFENSGGLNDDFWDNLDQWFDENPWFEQVLDIVGIVTAVLAVVVMLIPGVNVVVIAIISAVALVVTIVSVANAVVQVAVGRTSLIDGLIEVGLALIPAGIGRGLSVALRTTRAAAMTAASSSVMASAAGSGVSGVTRTVAHSLVEGLTTRLPGARLVTDMDTFVQLNALSKVPLLLSGGTVQALVPLAARGGYLMAGVTANLALPELASQHLPEVGGPTVSLRDEDW